MKIKPFNMVKSIASASIVAGVLAVSSGAAFAAQGDQINQVINVTATVPSTTFTVMPKTGTWPQVVGLNRNSTGFDDYKLVLSAKSDVGVSAYLSNAAELTNGSGSNIPLIVKLGGKTLSTSNEKVVQNTTAGTSETRDLLLEIGTGTTTTNVAGIYNGTVSLVFEDSF
ncbi:CS1 type fimbrial major subunit [Vibrio pomeroyi]|jgi:hypothetical protein|uniref:CS1 type fimbrial major subunit n=1 Tax=Vibrio TaxID=662 RepID=UPI0035A6DE05